MEPRKEPTTKEILEQEIAEAAAASAERGHLLKLLEKFPDLKKRSSRWGKIRYSTKAVNAIVTDCDISHNCGCCPDSPIEVWPYVIIEGVKIYSAPERFMPGEGNAWGYGERSYDNWQEGFKKEGIAEVVTEKVQQFFDENPEGYD